MACRVLAMVSCVLAAHAKHVANLRQFQAHVSPRTGDDVPAVHGLNDPVGCVSGLGCPFAAVSGCDHRPDLRCYASPILFSADLTLVVGPGFGNACLALISG